MKAFVGTLLFAAAMGAPAVPVGYAPAPYAPAPAPYHPEKVPPKPFAYEYGGADEYGRHFAKTETQDEYGVVKGEYRTELPDGRVQIVSYHADHENGFIADVRYEGEAHPEPAYAPAPHHAPVAVHAAHHAPLVAHPVPLAHAVHAAPLAHAPLVAHPAPLAHAVHAAPHLAHHAPLVAHPGHAVVVG